MRGDIIWQRLGGNNIRDVLASFNILLLSDGVRASRLESIDASVQLVDVLIGPLDF